MVWLKLDRIKDGDRIEQDVFLPYGSLYIPKDTILTQQMINKMLDAGIEGACIHAKNNDEELPSVSAKVFKGAYKKAKRDLIKLDNRLRVGDNSVINDINNIVENILDVVLKDKNILRNMNLIKSKDHYTYNHMMNVSILCALVAKWLGYDDCKIKVYAIAGLMHDIGKLSMPLSILQKPAKLSAAEYNIMRKHPIKSYEICKSIEYIDEEVLSAVVAHHERLDGSGYPFSLIEDKIPYGAKIVAIMDSYDAMTSDRPYKKRQTPFAALSVLQKESSNDFDAGIVQLTIKRLSDFLIGDMVKLNNGQKGKIVSVPVNTPDRPTIVTDTGYNDLMLDKSLYISKVITDDE